MPNQGYLSEAGASLVDTKLKLNVVPKTKVSNSRGIKKITFKDSSIKLVSNLLKPVFGNPGPYNFSS